MLKRITAAIPLLVLALSLTTTSFAQFGQVTPGSGFTVFGHVNLPNNKPAIRAKVWLEGARGITRDTLTDDHGQYEIRGLLNGRYRVRATHQDYPDLVCDMVEADSNRGYANRLQVDLYFKHPVPAPPSGFNAGTINADEANIPKAARKAYEQGVKLQQDKQADKALAQFTQAIELHPAYFQALAERGNVLMQANKLPEAEADFAAALKINGKYAPAWRSIGYCQIQQKQFAAAVRNLENAFALEPQAPMTLLLLGYGNLSLNRYEEAKQCLQEALRLDEKAAGRAHVYLGEVFAHEQNFKAAADEVQAYLKANPNAADATQLKALETQWRSKTGGK